MQTDPTIQCFLDTTVVPGVSRDERQIINYIKNKLKKWGFDFFEDGAGKAIGGNAGNLICKVRNGNSGQPPLLLAAHVDTVTFSSENPVIRNGRIESADERILGADDRVGVTILLQILEAISQNQLAYPNLDFVFIVAEEIGLRGSQYLDYKQIDAHTGINFDASAKVGQAIISAPSKTMFDLLFKGKEAHAAVAPEKGISSIVIAAETVLKIQELIQKSDLIFNMGTINGGGHSNVVPGKTTVSGEIRGFDMVRINSYLEQMQNIGEQIASGYHGTFELKYRHIYHSFNLDVEHRAVRLAREAVELAHKKFEPIRYRAGSDANIFNENHIKSINMGLGYANNHSQNEFITISDLQKGVEIGKNIVRIAAESVDQPIAEAVITEDNQ